jgi:type IV pilus assembly protein PilC
MALFKSSSSGVRDPQTPGTYSYEAITPTGARIKGAKARMNAYSAEDVRRELVSQGFVPITITELHGAGAAGFNLNMNIGQQGLKLKPQELAAFTRGLHQLVRAGVSVPRAVAALGDDAPNPELTTVCNDISSRIINGSPIAEAFAQHPRTFDDVFCGYLESGEKTGTLIIATGRLALLTEKRAQMHTKIRSVSTYPILVSIVIAVLVTAMITLIVPRFVTIYANFNSTLPAPTLLLIKLSHHFSPIHFIGWIPAPDPGAPLLWIILIIIGLRIYLKKTKDNPSVGIRVDKIRFHLPLAGKLIYTSTLFRWTSTLSGALEAGVRTTEALDMAARASGSRWIKAITPDIESALQAGQPLSRQLAEYPELFPAQIRTMVTTGETSGELTVMLDSCTLALNEEVDAMIAGLSAKVEVALILVMGAVVGAMVIALYLPIIHLAATVANTANTTTVTTTTLFGGTA